MGTTTVLRRLGTLVGVAIVVAALGLSLGQFIGLFRLVPVLSGSMSGFVDAGDAAVLRPAPVADLRVGDVIAFHPPVPDPPLTLHRIIDLERDGGLTTVRTRGDANALADPWRAQLTDGTAWRANGVVLPGAGTPVITLQRPAVRVALLGLTITILLFAVLRRIWEDPDSGDVPTPTPPPRPTAPAAPAGTEPATRRSVLTAAATIAVSLAAHALIGSGAVASFTGGDAASQVVAASWEAPPTGPAAELVCDLGVPTAVSVTWTASTSPSVTSYAIERGPAAGPFTEIGRTSDTNYLDDAVSAVLAGEDHYRIRGLTADSTTPATDAVGLLTVCA